MAEVKKTNGLAGAGHRAYAIARSGRSERAASRSILTFTCLLKNDSAGWLLEVYCSPTPRFRVMAVGQ
ncbi:MAG: hypothetical protein ACRC0P_12860, partial [Microbulbifer sp.]